MNIKLADLCSISAKLFAHLRELGIESLDVSVDYYWNIPKEQMYNPYQKPYEHDMGQLTDDWNELQKILAPSSQPMTYHFVWLAAILRAVGEQTPM